MASTAADIIASAKTEAEAARQSALSSLSGLSSNLETGYNTQVQSTKDYYNNMMNNLQNAYNQNAKSAYTNYQTDAMNLNNNLARLGLSNSGYGISQQLLAGSGYSKNLATLQNTLATNQANTGFEQAKQLADLYNTYLNNKNSIEQYLYEAGQKAYDTAYENSYKAQQDEISNALQQQYYNYLMSSGGGGGRSGGGYSSDYDPEESGGNALTTAYYSGDYNPDVQYGTFSNNYQPNNYHGSPLHSTGTKVDVKATTLQGSKTTVTQNVWKADNGNYYVWDGTNNKYYQTNKNGKRI